jgi:hypothetical protein
VKLSASKLELLERCPAAGALPVVWEESTDAQLAGTARHRYLQRAREVGPAEALAEIPLDAPWRGQCEAIPLEEVPEGEHELAYAYDVETDTARCLGPWLDRAYATTDVEVSGTLDLQVPGVPWLVIDFKGAGEVTAARDNLQLGFYALAVARVHGLDEVDVAIGYVGHHGGFFWDRARLGAFQLEAFAERVRGVAAAVRRAAAVLATGGTPDLATGLHCQRCPAMRMCPAHVAMVRALVAAPPSVDGLPMLSDEDAGVAWVRAELIEDQLKLMKASLRARAELSGLPLPGGERLVPVLVPRRKVVDLEKLLEMLREKFGAQVDALVERSFSAESIGALVRQIAPGKGVKKATDALRSELEAAGVLKSTSFVQLRVKKPGATATEEAA